MARASHRRLRSFFVFAVAAAIGCSGSGHQGSVPPPPRAAADASIAAAPVVSYRIAKTHRVVPGFDCLEAAAMTAADAGPPPTPSPFEDDRASRVHEATVHVLANAIVCAPPPTSTARSERWDRTTPPRYLDLVTRRFGLTDDEKRHLFADGVVVPARLEYTTYVDALRDIHRSELPLYVSVDAVLNAIYASNDKLIAEVESTQLAPETSSVIDSMHAALLGEPGRYAREIERDLDLYFKVARELIRDPLATTSPFTGDAEAAALVDLAKRAPGLARVRLFGRDRLVDFAQFRPRGHYAAAVASSNPHGADLSSYFRAAMWLSRIELNLVSRSSQSSSPLVDPTETPREASVAMALADLATRAGTTARIATIDGVWSALAGRREDVSIGDLGRLVAKAQIANVASLDAPARLRSAIADDFVRTARTHVQAEPSPSLPVIATFLGPRITADTSATRPIVHPEVPLRFTAPAVEMAFALGHDRALAHLDGDLATFPLLRPRLDRARDVMFERARWDGKLVGSPLPKTDLYSAWLDAVRGLAETPTGDRPSFMGTTAFSDMRVASTVAAYGQIRHNYVLFVPMTYDESGCEIPDGYVEPAPDTYRALIEYAERGERALGALNPGSASYFKGLGRMLRVLARIGDRELANEPITGEERKFLSMVAEEVKWRSNGYDGTPSWDGWYYAMHRSAHDALEPARLVADYFTSVNAGAIDYAGVKAVRMGLFVVDTGGAPRVMVGPVTHAFQTRGPLAPRYSDDDVDRIGGSDPWSASYTSAPVKEPSFTLRTAHGEADEGIVFEAVSTNAVGPVTVTLLDHHRVPVVTLTKELRGSPGTPAKVRFAFSRYGVTNREIASFGVEGVHVSSGDFHFFDVDVKQADLEAGEPKRWAFRPDAKRAPHAHTDLDRSHPNGRPKRY